jgi:formate hydrogenlyase subunit 6
MKLPMLFQPRILKTAIRSLFSRPYTTEYPKKKFEAIPEYRGRPHYHETDCIGCGACFQVCPADAIEMHDETQNGQPVRRLTHHHDTCIQCGQCVRYCTTEKGILMTNEWEFLGFKTEDFEETIRKGIIICEACGGTIAPLDQIKWLAARLGPLAFCNPTLMLASHKELAVVDPGMAPETGQPVRSRRINIQCPHCRRKTALNA